MLIDYFQFHPDYEYEFVPQVCYEVEPVWFFPQDVFVQLANLYYSIDESLKRNMNKIIEVNNYHTFSC